ncbi:BREX system P-loop protein BrxC [Vibrio harveyi]|uniref:BREX system P-loop protein BrxC n=1 Tax=Vibrio harveyi TaxID=669 RepID=A0ABN4L1Z2_VIBHA|nr:BREX system P-loop protein BrxC [Vibrio harveyi]AMF98506.1 BREX system P-loop protein BrxC [Vibrio harveyi]EKO3825090.1 BREX system P-loop protein BrxC [Vibrio harveyi]
MLNREIYKLDPLESKLANNGVAEVKDDLSKGALETLDYELRTFVCSGAYAKGMVDILSNYLRNVKSLGEQPAVWISGFFGSGKSHLAKMLRTLWVNQKMESGADARSLVELPEDIREYLDELSTLGESQGGLHAASGTLGAGAEDKVRLALLAIIFKSAGLSEQYHLAQFELWLRNEGVLEEVKSYIAQHAKGREGEDLWQKELRSLHVSPVMGSALLHAMPTLGSNVTEVRDMLRAQFKIVHDVSNTEMVQSIVDALSVNGEMPLTLVVLDEVQQYIADDPDRAHLVQETVETCCKAGALKSKLLFVATGQSALSGLQNLQRLMGRFQISVQLEDTDVDAVIRKVILQKKETARSDIESVVQTNLGEINRHLSGSVIEAHKDDEQWMVADYPLLPVRRRFWEKVLPALDKTGTGSQLRNQLRVVHEATKSTALKPLGSVVPADFIFEQIAINLLQNGVIGKEIYEKIARFKAGDEDSVLQGRVLSLILLISKLPTDINHGIASTEAFLADLMLDHLSEGKHELRAKLPSLIQALVDAGDLLPMNTSAGVEFRLQTLESQQWHDTFKQQQTDLRGNPQRLETFRSLEIKNNVNKALGLGSVNQGVSNESRKINVCFEPDLPSDAKKHLYAHVLECKDKSFETAVRSASPDDATIFIHVPDIRRNELVSAIVDYKAAETTLEVSGIPSTDAGKDARSAMEHRKYEAERTKKLIIKEIVDGIQVQMAGGSEVLGETLAEQFQSAGKKACERLYNEFKQADQKGWDKVFERASKHADANALEAVGHNDEVEKHPVCAAIKRYIGVAKTGAEVREHFMSAPYGWPKDTVDGVLYTLLAAGVLKASDSQERSVDAKSLERGKVSQTNFRPETVSLTPRQMASVRSFINAIGLQCLNGEEQSKLSEAIEHAKQLARKAGGDAPLPLPPKTEVLSQVERLSGNEQLMAAYEHHGQIIEEVERWKALGEKVAARQSQWSELKAALRYCSSLSGYDELTEEKQAIERNRSLLAEPNPVQPLLKQVIEKIRIAILKKYEDFQAEYTECLKDLQDDPIWNQLTSAQQEQLLKKHHLDNLEMAPLSDNDRVLDCIENTSLEQWSDKTSALAGRFSRMRQEAVDMLVPKAKIVQLPKSVIETEAELDAWLERVREEVMAALAENRPASLK